MYECLTKEVCMMADNFVQEETYSWVEATLYVGYGIVEFNVPLDTL